jgi:hypothetical protein
VENVYDQVELAGNYSFSTEHKKKMFYKFKKASLCFKSSACSDTVHCSELEYLISGILGRAIDDQTLQQLIMVQIDTNRHSRRHHYARFDFKIFVSLMCDLLKSGLDQSLDDKPRCSNMMFRLPLDPDSANGRR